MTVMLDLYRLTENERIKLIAAMLKEGPVPILLESDALAPGKIDRYIRKVRMHCPNAEATRSAGPVDNVETVTFRLA